MEEVQVKMERRELSMECDRNEFALALKTWRLRRALTQRQVASMFGCSRHTIIRAEAAQQVTWEMAYRLFARLAEELRKEGKENG